MAERDYYEVLGVPRTATADEIRSAHRKLARKHHPDVNPSDKASEARFKEAQRAYDVLGDPEKRKLYDQFGKAAFDGMGVPGGGQWTTSGGPGGPGFEQVDWGDLFGAQFGGAGARSGPEADLGGGLFDDLVGRLRRGKGGRRGDPWSGMTTEAELTIPFLTAVRGGEATIAVERDKGPPETLVVRIPPGTNTGSKLRLRSQGQGGSDLVVRIRVEPHPTFSREGRNLTVELPITVAEAVLGAKVDVPTLNGPKTLTIPPGSSSGRKLRLRGLGVSASRNKPEGDLYVVLKVVVPKSVDDESRRLIERFAERNPMRPRDGLGA